MKRKPRNVPFTVDYFFERSIPEPNSGCWIWLGATQWNGYGVIRFNGGTTPAHRAVYEIANNVKLPRNIDACHSCDVRGCVNPEHIFAGTRTVNMRDCANKGRIKIPGLSGEDCPAAVLTEREVLDIRASNLSQRELGRRYNVDKGTIAHILHRKTWRHI